MLLCIQNRDTRGLLIEAFTHARPALIALFLILYWSAHLH
jgi:hypothetical protein